MAKKIVSKKSKQNALLKQYIIYLVRWQLSTPVLWAVLYLMAGYPMWESAIISNLVGGLIFFWVDRKIFMK